MKRRTFNCLSTSIALGLAASPGAIASQVTKEKYVRLGGPVYEKYENPEAWISALKTAGYRAAYCPVKPGDDAELIKAYKRAASENDIVIAEVGAWSNPISPDEEMRKAAIEKCIKSLELAEAIGANCCVNISGSRNPEHWAGPHEDNLTDETFQLVVETSRKIIDAVKPTRTYFALEPMPWAYPDSPDNYLRLLRAIDRPRFGVHFDPVNMVVSPQLFYKNGDMIRDAIKKLGSHIRSCHAKDITLREDNYIPQLDECRPGLGKLDYAVLLNELVKLKDIPLMMEHLNTAEEYAMAAAFLRGVGRKSNIEL